MAAAPGVPGYLASVLHLSGDTPVGTCFQLTPGVLATAWHLLDRQGRGAPGDEVRFAPLTGGPAAVAVVDRVDPPNDLAVLRTSSPLPASVSAVASTGRLPPGTEVVVAGYAARAEHEGAHAYRYLTAGGRWGGPAERLDDGVRMGRLSTKDLLLGMSGAPVRRASDDAVVGVVRSRYNSPDGWLRDSAWTAWTEDLAALAPRELSWFSPHLRTHGQLRRAVAGQERSLTEVDFVPPGPGSKADPACLLDRLDAGYEPGGTAAPQRGILLEGVAGAGKSRTCFEVAERADLDEKQDWLVLHTVPGSDVSAADVVRAVLEHVRLAGATRALLVVDYLDGHARLKPSELGLELQEHDREGRIACLASARPGAMEGRAVQAVLDRRPLEDGEDYRARVAAAIFQKVAPVAWDRWGESRLVAACSDRPVLALLIARALEGQAARQDVPDLSDLRRGELFDWLRRRLERDFVDGPDGADPAAGPSRAPRTWLLASTVALLACPYDRPPVETAVDGAIDRRADDFAHRGGDVIARLRRQGWLVGGGDRLELVHDIVADGLLDAALVPGDTVRSRTAEELLDALLGEDPARTRSPLLAQAVRHLARWTTDQTPERRGEIEAACAGWLARRAHDVRELLVADALGRTAFDLVSRTPWQAGLLRLWDELVEPWLVQVEEQRPEAVPAVLAQAVDGTTGPLQERLLGRALACPEALPHAPETGMLLQALLHAELPHERLEQVAGHALDWARHHRGERRALQLLAATMGRRDLAPEAVRPVVAEAWKWARHNPWHSAGSVVLGPLLERDDLGPLGVRVMDAALSWVVRQHGNPGVSFVLPALLKRPDLGKHRDRAVGLALAWLHGHHSREHASFVLRPLLRTDLTESEAHQAVRYARKWLAANSGKARHFVLVALVRWDESAAGRIRELLDEKPVTEDRQYLLRDLLREPLPRPLFLDVVDACLDWLRVHGQGEDSTLLHLLLCRISPADEAWQEASRRAVRWLKVHSDSPDASYLLDDLLTAEPGDADVVRRALDWLTLPGSEAGASYVLRPLLWHLGDHAEEQAGPVVDRALSWLEAHAGRDEAGFVVEPLLHLRALSPGRAEAALGAAGRWLRAHPANGNTDRVLRPLLAREDVPPALRAEAELLAVAWLGRHPDAGGRKSLLSTLLTRPGPGPECATALLPHLLERTAGVGNATTLFISLLHTLPAGTAERATLIEHTLGWLDRRAPLNDEAGKVLQHLLAQPDLTEGQVARAAGTFLAGPDRPLVLAALLRHTAPAPWRPTVVARALAWLPGHTARPVTVAVLLALLRDPDPAVRHAAGVGRGAREWLAVNGPTDHRWAALTEALEEACARAGE
ncbi:MULTISPECIES: trypsin-like peptidase domain-containing protein [unclassified Streptomyces]|uniref:trypsin-like peptidase domain-containing protein n=1 Tax=unclassified Streptomyces TaxID=2593676 RepID=UPI0036C9EB16